MLTVSTMSGAWSVNRTIAVGGSAYGLLSSNWAWIIAVPSGGSIETSTFDGSITDFPLDNRGDRDCVHYQISGSLISHGDKFTRTVINPTGSGYVGPPLRIEEFHFPCSGFDNSFTAAGVITFGPQPWFKSFPDHSYPKLSFRKAWMKGVVQGSLFRIESHYEMKSSTQSTWTVYNDVSPWYEYDSTKKKFRPVGDSSWRSFLSLSSTGPVAKFGYNRLTSNDWGRILGRLSMVHRSTPDRDVFGDLCRRCANDAQLLDLNGIEYLSDIREISTELKSLLSLLRGKATLKSAAKLFLTYKYGLRLTVQDTISIFQAVPRHLKPTTHNFRWCRASESVTSTTTATNAWSCSTLYHYKVYYNPYDSGIVNLVDQLWSVGLFPSLENSWDLIPLSFVVDWFTQASDRLSAYDASTYWSCNHVLGGLGSKKVVYEGVQGDVIFPSLRNSAGVATVTEYARFGADTIVTPTFFTDAPREFKNYAEATALLISRSKKLK